MKVRKFKRADRDKYNTTGLSHLYWDLFDSSDSNGSGFRYMEREPILILDDILKEHYFYVPKILLGYTTKAVADSLGLPSISPYRVGKGVMLRVTNATARMFLVENLIIRGVKRIAVSDDTVEFDTDNFLYKPKLYIR
jgi:hypothetical protein